MYYDANGNQLVKVKTRKYENLIDSNDLMMKIEKRRSEEQKSHSANTEFDVSFTELMASVNKRKIIKIQANFRGFYVRKQFKELNKEVMRQRIKLGEFNFGEETKKSYGIERRPKQDVGDGQLY